MKVTMTIESQTGVNSVPPTENQAVNNQTAESTATEQTAAQESNEQSQEQSQETTVTASETQVPQINADLYDERGVPWKNVALEHKRKFEESQANLPTKIAEEVAKLTQQQQNPQYTIADLEKYGEENPQHRPWVEQEKARILKAELAQELEAKFSANQKAQQEAIVRQQSYNRVMSEFPQLAIKDQMGNFIGWNHTNPMTQAFSRYMSMPEFQVAGGDYYAAKLAFADMQLQKAPTTAKQMQSMKSQLRKAQAQTFVEGGGRKAGVENPNRKLMDRVRATGSKEDAAAVMRNIFKATGAIKE